MIMSFLNVPRETKEIVTRDYLVSNEEFVIKEVRKGLLKTTPEVSDKDIFNYYNSSEYLSHNKGSSLFSLAYSFASKFMLKRKLNLIAKYIDSSKRFLDFGCGVGNLVLEMKCKGFESCGVENNSKALSECDKKNIKVYRDLNTIKSQFDLVSCWHSIEHLLDYKSTLFQFNKLIVNEGYLIIAVPNHDSFDSKYYGKYWAGYDVPRHRYHFNKRAIVLAAKNAGFELLKSAPMLLDAFYVSILSEKYKKNRLGFFKGFLIGVLSTISYLFTNNASSHYFVFQKSN